MARKWPPIIPQEQWLSMSAEDRREAIAEWSSAPVLHISDKGNLQRDYDEINPGRSPFEWGNDHG